MPQLLVLEVVRADLDGPAPLAQAQRRRPERLHPPLLAQIWGGSDGRSDRSLPRSSPAQIPTLVTRARSRAGRLLTTSYGSLGSAPSTCVTGS